MKKLPLLLSLFFCQFLLSQYGTELPTAMGNVYYAVDLYNQKYDSPEGSPYLNEEFLPAKINTINETKLVRLDAFTGKIQVMVNAKQVVVLNDSQSYRVTLKDGSNRIFETHKFRNEEGILQTSFFELISGADSLVIYRKENIKFFEAQKAQVYTAGEPARFVKLKSTYYVKDFKENTNTLIEVPRREKLLIAFFPVRNKEIKAFIKKEKLKVDRTDDLLKVFAFYFEQT